MVLMHATCALLAQETGLQADNSEKNVKDVGLDPMHEALETPENWPVEFERQRRELFQLWQTCNVSLVHRTYFFLLFRGDPSDSIYMGVELKRLSFLKESLSQGNMAMQDGRVLSLASRFVLTVLFVHVHFRMWIIQVSWILEIFFWF